MEIDNNRFLEWGIPKRLLKSSWDMNEIIPDKIIKKSKSYIESFPTDKGLYILSSQNGVGKTYLASLITRELYYQKKIKRRFMFVDSSILDAFRDTNDDRYIDKVVTSDILVLDDFGKGKFSEWTMEKFYYIVNYRYNKLLPILFTSNYSPPQLINKVKGMSGEDMMKSIVSRIYEMCDIVDFNLFNVEDSRKKNIRILNGTH